MLGESVRQECQARVSPKLLLHKSIHQSVSQEYASRVVSRNDVPLDCPRRVSSNSALQVWPLKLMRGRTCSLIVLCEPFFSVSSQNCIRVLIVFLHGCLYYTLFLPAVSCLQASEGTTVRTTSLGSKSCFRTKEEKKSQQKIEAEGC